ncbi:olfactory receptor 6N1-like [Polymixia lowei]
MLIIFILIICGNSFVVYIICIHRSLHEPMYILIAALLMNSVFISTTIYPKLLIDFLSVKQVISYPFCVFQAFIYYSFGASEFLLLTAMSFDRYVSICKPLRYPTLMRITTIRIVLVSSWLLPACELAGIERSIPKTANFIFNLGLICYTPLFNPIIYGLKVKEISKRLKSPPGGPQHKAQPVL